ncbi:peptidase, partial [Streptomyces sp. SID625]|nr:peptidase [Streptomyces sp. SID625]
AGIVEVPGSRAVEVLARAGIDARELAAGIPEAGGSGGADGDRGLTEEYAGDG